MATNTNPIKYLNPIDLGGNELLNSLMEKLATAPLTPVAGRMYYNTTDNKAYLYNGTSWVDITNATQMVNVVVDATSTTLADYITNTYDSANFNEGDLLVLSSATDPAERVYVNLGTNNGDATDFVALSNAYDETEIKALFSATGGITYNDGVFTIEDNAIVEDKLSTEVQAKLNKTGKTYLLADTGVADVTYSNGIYTIAHNLNTRNLAVVMRDTLDNYKQIPVNNELPTVNTIEIQFAEQPVNNQYEVTVIPMIF